MDVEIVCAFCGKVSKKYVGHVNRAKKEGLSVYCNRTCAGLGRRHNKTQEQKKKEKSDYDKNYRYYHREGIKERRKEYFKKDYAANPEKYRKERKRRYSEHLKYLQTPEYKKWKQYYDEKFRAKKDYGVFWECSILLKELEEWLVNNAPEGMHFQMGITNKTQKRKRLWQKTIKNQKNLQQQV